MRLQAQEPLLGLVIRQQCECELGTLCSLGRPSNLPSGREFFLLSMSVASCWDTVLPLFSKCLHLLLLPGDRHRITAAWAMRDLGASTCSCHSIPTIHLAGCLHVPVCSGFHHLRYRLVLSSLRGRPAHAPMHVKGAVWVRAWLMCSGMLK